MAIFLVNLVLTKDTTLRQTQEDSLVAARTNYAKGVPPPGNSGAFIHWDAFVAQYGTQATV